MATWLPLQFIPKQQPKRGSFNIFRPVRPYGVRQRSIPRLCVSDSQNYLNWSYLSNQYDWRTLQCHLFISPVNGLHALHKKYLWHFCTFFFFSLCCRNGINQNFVFYGLALSSHCSEMTIVNILVWIHCLSPIICSTMNWHQVVEPLFIVLVINHVYCMLFVIVISLQKFECVQLIELVRNNLWLEKIQF